MPNQLVRHRSHRDVESGFSLIELMMVVLVIAILIAAAVPTFLGARKPAEDRQAQTLLKTSLIAAKTGSSDDGSYAWVTTATLASEESSVRYLSAATTARSNLKQVSVATGTNSGDTYVIFSSKAGANGDCFAVLSMAHGATQFQATTAATCNAGSFNPTVGWTGAW